jgi:hypothetical protein
MKSARLLFLILLTTSVAYAQTTDSLITAQGNVVSAETKEAVTAKITYQSLPYGNKIGVINNSTYSFPMFDKERYSIVVEAPGYVTAKYMLDPAEAVGRFLLPPLTESLSDVLYENTIQERM